MDGCSQLVAIGRMGPKDFDKERNYTLVMLLLCKKALARDG
jgi:hypothetical protein